LDGTDKTTTSSAIHFGGKTVLMFTTGIIGLAMFACRRRRKADVIGLSGLRWMRRVRIFTHYAIGKGLIMIPWQRRNNKAIHRIKKQKIYIGYRVDYPPQCIFLVQTPQSPSHVAQEKFQALVRAISRPSHSFYTCPHVILSSIP
jgi:hypothetical protein